MISALRTVVALPLDDYVEGELPSVMALDPGGTTGWAWFNPEFGNTVYCGQLTGEHHTQLLDLLTYSPFHVGENNRQIVSESFQFRQFEGFDKSKVVLDSVEYIGVIKLYSQLYGVPIEWQTASTAKHFVADLKLRRMDWYKATAGMVHARDALRHLLFYMVVTKKIREPITNKWFNREVK